jgi:hypothetical protein
MPKARRGEIWLIDLGIVTISVARLERSVGVLDSVFLAGHVLTNDFTQRGKMPDTGPCWTKC